MTLSITDPVVEVDPSWNTITLLDERVRTQPDDPIIEVQSRPGDWIPISARAFRDEVNEVSKGLIAKGLAPRQHVGLMSRTRYEWTLFDYAIWTSDAVTVPIYETSSVSQIEWICQDSELSLVITETPGHAALVEEAANKLHRDITCLVIENGAVSDLKAAGLAIEMAEVTRRREKAGCEDLATIIYTSGTTGRPKGVELTHGNFVRLTQNTQMDRTEYSVAPVIAATGCRTLLFLPLAHVFARFIQVLAISSRTVQGHCPDTANLLADLASFQPTFLLAVPRVFEKVYNSAEQSAGSGLKLKVFRWAAYTAVAYSMALDSPSGPSFLLKARHRLADRLVYSTLRRAIGGKATYAVSGGAALGERLGHFFRGVGLMVLEGYGLTETTAPIVVNRLLKQKIGSVGKPFPGAAVMVDEEGAILVKGLNVFANYHNNPEASRAAFRDGWFDTGDVGRLDDDGYLYVTGRRKELIVTAGGKNVAPAILEDRLRGHPLVSQCVVVGDNRPFVAALVTLDVEMLPGWLINHGLPVMTPERAAQHGEVLAALQRAVDRTNQAVSRAESIRKFAILDQDFTEENGYLTPSLKVKRDLVLNDFADQVDQLYQR